MNTSLKFWTIINAVFLCSACAKPELKFQKTSAEGTEITITATKESFSPDTKTARISDGSVNWCPSDEISIFYATTEGGGSRFTAQNTDLAPIAEFKGKLAGFSGVAGLTNGEYLYGVYPYSTSTSIKDGVITISLPSNQTAVEGTFANGLFPTIARAQALDLNFYNICGGVKFTVSRNDISSVVFKGNNDERIAGTVNVVFDGSGKPLVTEEEIDSKTEITVFAPAGGTFKVGKEYYLVAYPVKLGSGYSISYQTSGMKEGTFVNNKSVEIKRSIFGVINQADKNISSWADIISGGGGENEGIYLGIMGFNQQLYSYSVKYLSSASKPGFDSFIDDLNMKNGTLLYYSVEQAINKLQRVQLPDNLSTVAIVTFTDGLDQGSFMMNDSYKDNTEYLNALNNRIKTEKIGGQPITAYSIGIKGSDVADVTTFRNNLTKLASSSSNAIEVTSMAAVNAKFKEIAERLSKSNYIQKINLTMPGVSNGTLIRFTFDNVSSAKNSTLYIEGTFNRSTFSLDNIKYVGLTSSSGTTVKGVVNGIFVTFTFEDVHTDNNVLIDSESTDEWTYVSSGGIWQINSEFDKTENSDIVTKRSSAIIMLVLDCSSSLASDFPKAQTNAKDFINTLYEGTGGESGIVDIDMGYVDLGLSVKWASCNLGASKPSAYGGYYQWAGTKDVSNTSINLGYSNCPYHAGSSSSTGWTKYVYSTASSYWGGSGNPDNKTVLDIEDDAACIKLGSRWRMPTKAEWQELRSTSNCTWTWTTVNGVKGFKVTSKKPGYTNRSIFLPAAGRRSGTTLNDAGSYGYYWSSSLFSTYSYDGTGIHYFNSDSVGVYGSGRYRGQSVRPVYGDRVSVTGVNLGKTSLSLEVDATSTLSATVTPSNAAEQSVSWSSSAPSVATVDASGKVTAVKAGSATITVTTTDGGKTATCAVKVKAALPANALPGVFSVSDTKQVHFSKGNLYYDGSNFNFEANQYGFNSSYQSTYVSHFYWSKDADEAVKQDFNWEQSMSAGDVFFTNVDGFKVNVGGKDQTGWRTLSTNEWQYLFNTRENANTKYGFATVGNVTGIILLPDTFTDPMKNGGSGAFVPKSTTGWTANTYTTGGNWEAMESAGAVFLPAAGSRNGSNVTNVGDDGYYWSSTAYDEYSAYFVYFISSNVRPDIFGYYRRNRGSSVRLITESK